MRLHGPRAFPVGVQKRGRYTRQRTGSWQEAARGVLGRTLSHVHAYEGLYYKLGGKLGQ